MARCNALRTSSLTALEFLGVAVGGAKSEAVGVFDRVIFRDELDKTVRMQE